MPEISVIVPVYNVEPYLCRCVDSILAQTFRDFELVLVDDGSPDGCPAICDAYAAQDPRVVVIHQENGGLSVARNAGIDWAFAHSGSRWLAFVDSDDWVHPRFLEYLRRAAEETGTEITVCGFEKATEQLSPSSAVYQVTVEDAMELFGAQYLISVVAWNKLYRRELFKDRRYPAGKLHEDAFLTHALFYQAKQAAWVHCSLYAYFQNDSGITRSTYSLKRLDEIEAVEAQLLFFQEHGEEPSARRAAVRLVYTCRDHLHKMEEAGIPAVHINALLKKLRRLLRKYKKRYGLDISAVPGCYETAWPRQMGLYWKWRRARELGLTGAIGRAWRKIWKSKT